MSQLKDYTDYDRVADAIGFLRSNLQHQPTLADVADYLQLSESHVQKLFTRWAGISPKRFLQYLTVEHAKQRMHDTGDLFGLALDTGLSSAGRLHDLFVNMEAMSPGEFKQAANGMTIRFGSGATPFGPALIATTERGICHLSFMDGYSLDQAATPLAEQWPQAQLKHDSQGSDQLLQRVFSPEKFRKDKPLSLCVSGTNFQIQVWRALLQIPFAGLLNYQQLAQLLGKPKAARAVGNAVAKNRIAYLIPCHRVLRQSGDVGKYYWGSTRKAALHIWEAEHNPRSTTL